MAAMKPLARLLLDDTLTPEQARVLSGGLDREVAVLELYVQAYPEDKVAKRELLAGWDLQAKLFGKETLWCRSK